MKFVVHKEELPESFVTHLILTSHTGNSTHTNYSTFQGFVCKVELTMFNLSVQISSWMISTFFLGSKFTMMVNIEANMTVVKQEA